MDLCPHLLARSWTAVCLTLLTSGALAAEPPDWVKSGGSAAKYPSSTHLTGFGVAEGAKALDAAKGQATADLAKRITVRIEQEVTDVSIEKNGAGSYAVAAMTRATTDVRLSGVSFETYNEGSRVHALAILARKDAALTWRAEREQQLEKTRACLAQGDEQRAAKKDSAVRAFLGCRAALAQALEADAMARAVQPGTPDPAILAELAKMSQALDDRVRDLLGQSAPNMKGVIDRLATQLELQGVGGKSRITVAPLTYGTSPFSSALGRRLAEDLDVALAAKSGGSVTADMVVKGTYFDAAGEVAIRLVARDAKSGRTVAGAEARMPVAAVPPELPLTPQNFAAALKDQHLLGEGEEVSGALRVELWTNKGDRNLVFQEGDELKLFIRVNRPAFVRLVYLLASGVRVPLEQAYYIDESKVNLAVEYPDSFTVSRPFGIEQVFAVAFTERPEPLATVKQMVDGEEYDVVAEAASLVRHRGAKRKQATAQTSEAIVSLTTTPR